MIEATIGKHPAVFTESIIEALEVLIPLHVPRYLAVHDPFAGEGLRLGALCDKVGRVFTGVDLEPWKDHDPRVYMGDSTDPDSYPGWPHAIVTSPTYNNGINDHFKPKDESRRLTYRVRAGRELHVNNTGRYSGRGSNRGEATYWRITRACVEHWPDVALVNVKDSVRGKGIYPLVQKWVELLASFGYEVEQEEVACPGWRFGANGQARLDTEAILIARRA